MKVEQGIPPWNPPLEQAMQLPRRIFVFRRTFAEAPFKPNPDRLIEYTICLN